MKLLLLTLLAVGALAADKPQISLTGSNLVESTEATLDNGVEVNPNYNSYFTNQNGHLHTSKKSLVITCNYDQDGNTYATATTACALPVATAQDSDGANVGVTISYYRYENRYSSSASSAEYYTSTGAGRPSTDAGVVLIDTTAVHMIQMLKYDAEDASGNRATQVTVAFTIQDNKAPTLNERAYNAANDNYQATVYGSNEDNAPAVPTGHSLPWQRPALVLESTDEVDGACVEDNTLTITGHGQQTATSQQCHYRYVISTTLFCATGETSCSSGSDGHSNNWKLENGNEVRNGFFTAVSVAADALLTYNVNYYVVDSSANWNAYSFKYVVFADEGDPEIHATSDLNSRECRKDQDTGVWEDRTVTCKDWFFGTLVMAATELSASMTGLTLTSTFDDDYSAVKASTTATYLCTKTPTDGADKTISTSAEYTVVDTTDPTITASFDSFTLWAGTASDFTDMLTHEPKLDGVAQNTLCSDTVTVNCKLDGTNGSGAQTGFVGFVDHDGDFHGCSNNPASNSEVQTNDTANHYNANNVAPTGHNLYAQTEAGVAIEACKPLFWNANLVQYMEDNSYVCEDACDVAPVKATIAGTNSCSNEAANVACTGNTDFDHTTIGTWEWQFSCTDATAHVTDDNHRVRVTFQDKMRPIINLKHANNPQTVNAVADGQFTDEGAECTDLIDLNINQNIHVTGQVVNMAKPDTYFITYGCKDNAGNEAIPFQRTVIVQELTAPTLSLVGEAFIVAEVGFAYTMEKCNGGDVLSGNDATTFLYTIADPTADATYTAWAASGHVCPFTHSHDWSANYCDILEIRSRSHPRSSASIAGNDWTTCETSVDTSRANGLDKEYRIEYFALSNSKVTSFSDTISARDHANDDCSLNSRVCRHVVVRDTLPPIITVQHSQGTVYGTNLDNYAGDHAAYLATKNVAHTGTHFSANREAAQSEWTGTTEDVSATKDITSSGQLQFVEDSSVQSGINGWVVGAIASAISGLALLGYAGYSMKKRNGYTSTVMSVPV